MCAAARTLVCGGGGAIRQDLEAGCRSVSLDEDGAGTLHAPATERGVTPLTIPVGYMNDNVAYVPDGPNLGDHDYQSAFYRYTTSFLPYRKPGGDLLARAGLRMLKQLTPTTQKA